MEDRLIDIGEGEQLHAVDTGGGHTPIVFIHGTALDVRMWDAQIKYFQSRRRVIAYDLRGFGRSTALISGRSYSNTHDLEALLSVLVQKQKVHLVGLSRGGRTAINCVLDYPERFASLVLCSANINGLPLNPEFDEIRTTVSRLAKSECLEAAKKAWLNASLFASARRSESIYDALQKMIADYDGWHWKNTDTETRSQPEAEQRLNEIVVPTLVISGQDDIPHFQNAARTLISKIPLVKHLEIAGAGHMVPMEQPAAFNSEVEHFITAIAK